MRLLRLRDRLVFITIGLGIALYCVADGSAWLGVVAMGGWLGSWLFVRRGEGEGAPKSAILLLLLAATVHAGASIALRPTELILLVSRYLVWLHLIKLYDRSGGRDEGQLLTMNVFLVLGGVLTSNEIEVGALLLVYVPLLFAAVLLHHAVGGLAESLEAERELRPSDRRRLDMKRSTDRSMWRDLATTGVFAGMVAAVIAMGVFVIMPRRVGMGVVAGLPEPDLGAVSGFRDEVQLGGAGLINESTTPVFEVRITDEDGEPIARRLGTVLLRGAVLDEYQDGQWRRAAPPERLSDETRRLFSNRESVTFPAVESDTPIIVQEYVYRNRASGPAPVFSINRPVGVRVEEMGMLFIGRNTQTMKLESSGRVSFTVTSQPNSPLPAGLAEAIPRQPLIFQDGPVRELAERLLRDAGLERNPELRHSPIDGQIADTMQRFLRRGFSYTRDQTSPEELEDPIEMFLLRTKEGHCEYFAAGMTALLRSLGVEARVVTGYVAIERIPGTEVFTVRESNAHAWVEAHVAPGLWRTYDPSPPSDVIQEHEPDRGVLASIRGAIERIERFWINNVVAFDNSDAGPLTENSSGALNGFARRVERSFLSSGQFGWKDRILSAVLAGATVFGGVTLGCFVLVYAARWLQRRFGRRIGGLRGAQGGPSRAVAIQLRFFDDLLRAFARAGLARPEGRPALAHVRATLGDPELADKAARLVGLYYAGRFGGRRLDDRELGEAHGLLRELKHGLAHAPERAT